MKKLVWIFLLGYSLNAHSMSLCLAARLGYVARIFEILEENPTSIEHKNPNGDTALAIAAEFGREQVVEALLAHGAQVQVRNQQGFTPLMLATIKEHVSIMQKLIEAKAKYAESDQRKLREAFLAKSKKRFQKKVRRKAKS